METSRFMRGTPTQELQRMENLVIAALNQRKKIRSSHVIVYCDAYLEQNGRPKLKRRMGGLPRTKMSGGDMNRTNKNRILEMKILKPTRSAIASNQESGVQTLGNIGESEGGENSHVPRRKTR